MDLLTIKCIYIQTHFVLSVRYSFIVFKSILLGNIKSPASQPQRVHIPPGSKDFSCVETAHLAYGRSVGVLSTKVVSTKI